MWALCHGALKRDCQQMRMLVQGRKAQQGGINAVVQHNAQRGGCRSPHQLWNALLLKLS